MPPVAAIDQGYCETVCRTASLRGFGLREKRLAHGYFAFYWRFPDGGTHACAPGPNRGEALTIACEWLLKNKLS